MANTDIINYIIQIIGDAFKYMVPIIGILSGIILIITLFLSVTIGAVRRFKL